MAGNRELYEQAMVDGNNAAWEQNWQVAVASYTQAIREFPDDLDAHMNLGLGLLELGRPEGALKVYTVAQQLAPNDPIPLEKGADALERLGRLREAATQYIRVAELYLAQRDLRKSIANWDRATRLTPGLLQVHLRLAQAYEQIGDQENAIREYLMLAYDFQNMNDLEKAVKAVERALRVNRNSTVAINALQALHTGRRILPPAGPGTGPLPLAGFDREAKRATSQMRKITLEADPLGPLGEAMNVALSALAVSLMENELTQAASDALAGLELQRQNMPGEAIGAYKRAEASLDYSALKLNLGGLLLQRELPEDALSRLDEAADDPTFAVGALHGVGQALAKLRRYEESNTALLRVIQAVDPAMHIDDPEHAPLRGIYSMLSDALTRESDEIQKAANVRFLNMLQGRDWKTRLPDARRQWEETVREQQLKGLIDILTAQHGDVLADAVAHIDRYIRQGMYVLAMDEAHHAIELSPGYLPVHVRMAEIMMKEGRMRQSVTKYNTVARTFLARGDNRRAADILTSVLETAPMDVSLRESLIDLLKSEERWDDVLDQYIDLADVQHQLGNYDVSRDTYILAERIAGRTQAAPEKMVHVKHRIADIDQMRLDMRRAVKTYEEIIQIAPDDERAYRMLVDINFRQGNSVEAVRRLDKLLGIYARQKQVNRIVQLLEEQVALYPNDMGLRSRLASVYRQLGRISDAIRQLDALGELQLDAGLNKDAANTIRQIIGLNPDHMDDYRKLLSQLGG
ncbi:MAG: tetratricopeptide repeat protein [Anaerolineae bacterium]